MKLRVLIVAVIFTATGLVASAADLTVLPVWPDTAPGEPKPMGPERVRMSPAFDRKKVEVTVPTRLITDVSHPTLTVYRPNPAIATRAAVIICPGGGYWDLYWQLEGEEVAEWLNSIGVTGIILKYRVPRRPGEREADPAKRPLQDAQRAVSLVRSRAMELNIDSDRIGVVGFSAGGHLAIATATEFHSRSYAALDAVDAVSCRVNFAMSIYPGYLKAAEREELAPTLHVPRDTPPVFLAHGGEDLISSPQHSLVMFRALRNADVPAELHIYAGAAHDFGVRKNERSCSNWTEAARLWMKSLGILDPASPKS